MPHTPTLDAEAWCRGYDRGLIGASQSTNPYSTHSEEGLSWIAGHIEGQTDRIHPNAPMPNGEFDFRPQLSRKPANG